MILNDVVSLMDAGALPERPGVTEALSAIDHECLTRYPARRVEDEERDGRADVPAGSPVRPNAVAEFS